MKKLLIITTLLCLVSLSLFAQEKNVLRGGAGVNVTSSKADLYKPSFGPLVRVEYERVLSDWFSVAGHVQGVANRSGEYHSYWVFGAGAQALFRPFSGFFHRLNLGLAAGLERGEIDKYVQEWEDPATHLVERNQVSFASDSYLNFGPTLRFNFVEANPLSASVFVHPQFYYDPIDKDIKCWFVNIGLLCGLGF